MASSTIRSDSWSTISSSSDFYYRPAGEIVTPSFRIVHLLPGRPEDAIRCEVRAESLHDKSVRFVALSYCWNSVTAEEVIWCDARPLKITQNLYAALRNARATNTVVNLWIDQLCIDQDNLIDRNEQVSKMGAIYRAASGVVVWLGEEGPGTSAAMELPQRVRKYWPRLYDDPDQLTDHAKTPAEVPKWGSQPWLAFGTLLLRPWFRRLWVIQEVACAQNILITCGTATAFWNDFIQLAQAVEFTRHTSVKPSQVLGTKTAAQYIGFMQELRIITRHGSLQATKDYASEESIAPWVLMMAKDCEATDHRDKLFAFHHLVRLWNRPDYAINIEMLYQLFAVQYLQRIAYAVAEFSCDEQKLFRRQVELIYTAGTCNQHLALPSWVPDWSVPWRVQPLWLDTTCYSAGGPSIEELSPTTELSATGEPQFRLPLTVKTFDRILSVSAQSLHATHNDYRELPEALRGWLFSALEILHRHRAPTSIASPYPDRHTAMARTVLADQDQGARLAVPDALRRYAAMLEFLREPDDDAADQQQQQPPHSSPAQLLEYEKFHHSTAGFLRGRVFFVTEKGYFGLAQHGVARADNILVVRGAPIPIVTRPALAAAAAVPNPPAHTLLCDAYVLGVMDGEVWADDAIAQEGIVLV